MVDDDEKTLAKTLWSETIIDMLIATLKANKSDDQIKELLNRIQKDLSLRKR